MPSSSSTLCGDGYEEACMSQGEGEEHLVPLWGKRSLPRLPFIVMADLFRSRHLLKLLVKRDLNARYRRAYLGYAWAVLEPLLLAIVYTFIFTILVGSSDPLYPVKIVIGIIGWSMFARSLTTSTKSLSGSINLFQFARVPKTVFATSGTLTNAVLALISLSSLIPFYFISDLPITANLLLVPFWLLVLSFTGWGIGLLLAPIACKVPDVLNLINFLVRAGFFLSPVMWTYDMFNSRFGEGWHAVVAHLNPTVIPITGMRDAVLGEPSLIPTYAYVMCFSIALLGYIFGSIVFERKAHRAVVNV
jgi:ABC-type polysaccharide/polyol phosphate export permease